MQSNNSNPYYNFSNIRYAAPPLGNLRFRAPSPPLDNRSIGVQDGTYGNICPQAYATWQLGAKVLNPPASVENEDCLFLDVVVSPKTFNGSGNASVIIWIHGGAYTIGSKISSGVTTNPAGLLDTSFNDDGNGAIWVGMNYRVRFLTKIKNRGHWQV